VTVRSYAKINLGLRILGKRPDGYHDLVTVFQYIDLYDTLTLTPTASGASMECSREDLPCDDRNLCIRAAKAILALTGSGGVHIVLVKRIPSGAGLGGGSSNAAAVLRVLPALLGVQVGAEELHSIAAGLGSDVPFFLQDSSAEAQGRGEILRPVDFRNPWWILTVTPDVHVSTAWAYGSLRLSGASIDSQLTSALTRGVADESLLAHALINDFEPTVMESFPDIASLRNRLLASGAIAAAMSGSGSSVYGLYTTEAAAAVALERIPSGMTASLTAPGFSPVFVPPLV